MDHQVDDRAPATTGMLHPVVDRAHDPADLAGILRAGTGLVKALRLAWGGPAGAPRAQGVL